jgi:hypothetical protein
MLPCPVVTTMNRTRRHAEIPRLTRVMQTRAMSYGTIERPKDNFATSESPQ